MCFNFEEGEVLFIDKPYKWTSFDVVKKIRGAIKIKKIGHAGTLDPLATGLLILCTGKKTKQINDYQAQEKEYTGTLVLGKTTPSFDLETNVIHVSDILHITDEEIIKVSSSFLGEQMQTPPMFSAVKIEGKRVYEHARKGEEVKIEPREITIKQFDITRIALPEIDFKIVCSKGTYIRAIVRDFGLKLNTGAYLSALRRTRIGGHQIAQAFTIEDMLQKLKKNC